MNRLQLTTIFALLLVSCVISQPDYRIICAPQCFVQNMIECQIPIALTGHTFTLHVFKLGNSTAYDFGTLSFYTPQQKVAVCSFKQSTKTVVKGKHFQVLLEDTDIYRVAMTVPWNPRHIITSFLIYTQNHHSCDMTTFILPCSNTEIKTSSSLKVNVSTDGCKKVLKVIWEVSRTFYNFREDMNCFYDDLMRQVSLEKFIAMETFRPADFILEGKHLYFPAHSLPIGFIFFKATLIMNTTQETYMTYVRVLPETNISNDNKFLSVLMDPFPDLLVWFEGRSLVLDAMKTNSRHLTADSGFVGDPDNFLKFTWRCILIEGERICDAFSGLDSDVARVVIESSDLTRNTVFKIHLKVTLSDLNQDLAVHTLIKGIKVYPSTWPLIEMRCIHNCGNVAFGSSQQVVRFHCPDCFLMDENPYKIRWTGKRGANKESTNETYYKPTQLMDTISLLVSNSDGDSITFTRYYHLREDPPFQTELLQTLQVQNSDYSPMVMIDIYSKKSVYKQIVIFDYDVQFYVPVINEKLPTENHVQVGNFTPIPKRKLRWASTFNDAIINLPALLANSTTVLSQPAMNRCYSFLNGTSIASSSQIFKQPGKFVKVEMSFDEINEYWDSLKKVLPISQGLGFIYQLIHFINYQKVEAMDSAIFHNLLEMLSMRYMSYTDCQLSVSILEEIGKSKFLKINYATLTYFTITWRRILSTLRDINDDHETDNDCILIQSVSELYLRSHHQNFRFDDRFLTMIKDISKYHFAAVFREVKKICFGEKWYMMWNTSDFRDENSTIEFHIPGKQRIRLESVVFNTNGFRTFVKKKDNFIDFELNFFDTSKQGGDIVIKGFDVIFGTVMIGALHRSGESHHLLNVIDAKNAVKLNFISQPSGPEVKTELVKCVVDGNLKASDCLIFQIDTSTDYGQTLVLNISDHFTMGVGYLQTKHLKDILEIFESDMIRVKSYKGSVDFFLDKVTKAYKYNNRNSKHLFVINVTATDYTRTGFYYMKMEILLITVGCFHWDQVGRNWNPHFCSISKNSENANSVGCTCSSTGLFTAGLRHRATNIDMSVVKFVKGVLDLGSNYKKNDLLLESFVIGTWIVYIAFLVWAIRKDCVCQNMFRTNVATYHFKLEHQYHYLIQLKTSVLSGSGTTSRAFLVLIGSLRTSGEMMLDNFEHFMDGSESWFLTSMAKPLGLILGCQLRIDCSGLNKSWLVSSVHVYDVTRDILVEIPCNEALSEDIPVRLWGTSNNKHYGVTKGFHIINRFSHYFWKYHFLMVVFLGVPGAHNMAREATRLHCMLLTSLVASVKIVVGQPKYRMGDEPITISPSPFFVVIILMSLCNLIVYMLFVCFPLHKPWGTSWQSNTMPDACVTTGKIHQTDRNNSKNEEKSVLRRPNKVTSTHKVIHALWIVLVGGFMIMSSWYLCLIGSYQLKKEAFMAVVGAGLVCITDVIVLQPLFILIFALISSLMSREMIIHTMARNRSKEASRMVSYWKELQRTTYRARPRSLASFEYKEMNSFGHTAFVSKLNRLKRHKISPSKGNIKEGLRLVMFVAVTISITYFHGEVTECFLQKELIFDVLKMSSLTDESLILKSVTVKEMWKSIEDLIKNHLHFITRKSQLDKGATSDQLIIVMRIRQVRVKPYHKNCPVDVPEVLFPRPRCLHELNSDNEETGDFYSNWTTPLESVKNEFKNLSDNSVEEKVKISIYEYHPPDVEASFLIKTKYPLGGYQLVFKEMNESAVDVINLIKQTDWVDENTRALFVEMSLFNINTGIASPIQIRFQFQLNGIFLSSMCNPFPMTFEVLNYTALMISITFLVIHLVQTLTELLQTISAFGLSAFLKKTSLFVDAINIVFCFFLLALFSYRFYLTQIKQNIFAKSLYGKEKPVFVDLNDLADLVITLNDVVGFLSFVVLFMLLKTASKIKRLDIMLKMIKDVFVMFISPSFCVMAVAFVSYYTFSSHVFYFHTLHRSFTTTVQFIVGPLDISAKMRQANLILGPIILIVQWVIFFLVVTNGFLVALNEDYSVRMSRARQSAHDTNILESIQELAGVLMGVITVSDKNVKDEEKKHMTEQQMKDDLKFLRAIAYKEF